MAPVTLDAAEIADRLVRLIAERTGIAAADIQAKTFFELGGDSLFLLELSSGIEAVFGVNVPFRTILEELSSVEALAAHIAAHGGGVTPSAMRGGAPDSVRDGAREATADARAEHGRDEAKPRETGAESDAIAGGPGDLVIREGRAERGAGVAGGDDGNGGDTGAGGFDAANDAAVSDAGVAFASAPSVPGDLRDILVQQLDLMARQLDLIRAHGAPAGAAERPAQRASVAAGATHPAAVPAMAPELRTRATATTTNAATDSAPIVAHTGAHAATGASANVAAPSTAAASVTVASEVGALDAFVPHRPIEARAGRFDAGQSAWLDRLVDRLVSRTSSSKQYTGTFRRWHADSRGSAGFQLGWKELCYPIAVDRAAGARFWDLDGNEYVDVTMGFGSLLFGHSPAFLMEALHRQLDRGVSLGPQSPIAGEVAELVCRFTGMERVAFCNSGTEAVMTALRIARTVTGRSKTVMFAGSYHGTFDGVLARAAVGEGGYAQPLPSAPGVTRSLIDHALVLEYGSPDSLAQLERDPHDLAAILVEPVQSRRPDISTETFLRELRRIADRKGAALIFDEVVTGFRLHPGGSQALFGVRADLATYGKAFGGGMPIGAVAGSTRFMDAVDGGAWSYGDRSYPTAQTTLVAGTFFKHPFVMAGARAVLQHLQAQGPALQEQLNARTAAMADRLNAIFARESARIHAASFGSLFRFLFPRGAPFAELFYHHLLSSGIFVWEGRVCYLSTAHTDADIDAICDAVQHAVHELKGVGLLPLRTETTVPPSQTHTPLPSSASSSSPFASAAVQEPAGDRPVAAGALDVTSDTAQVEPHVIEAPLTDSQRELWFLAQLDAGGSRAFNVSTRLQIRGAFDAAAMQRAFQHLVTRHEALRTTIARDGSRQCIASARRVDVPLVDLRSLAPDDAKAAVDAQAGGEAATPIDLAEGPLVRFRILAVRDDEHVCLLTVHHIIADAWSFSLLQTELMRFYGAERRGQPHDRPPAMQLSAYLARQARLEADGRLEADERYWVERLRGAPQTLDLPERRPTRREPSARAARATLALDRDLSAALRQMGARCGATPFMVLLGLFQAWLHRLSAQRDLIVGIFAAGRGFPGAEGLVAHCVKLLPIRSRVDDEATVQAWLTMVRGSVAEAQEHHDISFSRIVRALRLPRERHRQPLVTVTFNMDPAPRVSASGGAGAAAGAGGASIDGAGIPTASTVTDLTCNADWRGDQLVLEWDYDADAFTSDTLARWQAQFRTLLRAAVDAPESRLSALNILSESEHRLLVETRNATIAPVPAGGVHEAIAAQARRTPDAVAVQAAGAQITYRTLDRRANRLARVLRAQGAGPETRVGIALDRSVDLVVALLAILKAGAAYLPLDRTHPAERLRFMLEDAGATLLITNRDGDPALLPPACTTIALDRLRPAMESQPATPLRTSIDAASLAYVIYTSGSTGRPKGVQIAHHALANLIAGFGETTGIRSQDVLAAVTPVTFDIAGLELYLPLVSGARLALLPHDADGEALAHRLTAAQATLVQATPAAWRMLLGAGWRGAPHLRLLCGGEALPADLARDLRVGGARAWNVYGPTETTIWSTVADIASDATTSDSATETATEAATRAATDTAADTATGATAGIAASGTPAAGEARGRLPIGDAIAVAAADPAAVPTVVPIGRPIANTQVYVVDAAGQLAPAGVTGELWIAGDGLARGYAGRPALTAERFVPARWSAAPGARAYRTGDLVRWRADGELAFVGRRDHQVKIRGHRVEPGEIEAALTACDAVRAAVVTVQTMAGGETRLVAHVVPADPSVPEAVSTAALRAHLQARLPAYMMPALFLPLARLPLTPHGKVDRAALPEPPGARPSVEAVYVAPRTAAEQTLAGIWSRVLQVAEVGVTDNFFELGGDSILAIQIVARAREAGLLLAPRQLFEHQTVEALARVGEVPAAASVNEQGLVTGPVPLTPMQAWFFEQALADPQHCNQARWLAVPVPVDAAALQTALEAVVAHHDALRLRFRRVGGVWQQEHAPGGAPVLVMRVPLGGVPPTQQAAVQTAAAAALQTRLDLAAGPLLTAALCDGSAAAPALVLLIVHRLVIDELSWPVLAADLATAYAQAAAGEPVRLPPKTSAFQAWARRLQTYARSTAFAAEAAYWTGIAGTPAPALPVEETTPANSVDSGRTIVVALTPAETMALLQSVPQAYHTQITEVLVTALCQTLNAWTGGTRARVALERPGRTSPFEEIDLSRTVGWFTTLQVATIDLTGVSGPGESLKSVKEQLRRAPHGGLGYGIWRYLVADRPRENGGAASAAEAATTAASARSATMTIAAGAGSAPEDAAPHLTRQGGGESEGESEAEAGETEVIFSDLAITGGAITTAAAAASAVTGAVGGGSAGITGTAADGRVPHAPFEIVPGPTGPDRSPRQTRPCLLQIEAAVRDGQLCTAWTYSAHRHTGAAISGVAEHFLAGLRALIEHCLSPAAGGYTPSDFPLAGLDQQKLDLLLRSLARTGASPAQTS